MQSQMQPLDVTVSSSSNCSPIIFYSSSPSDITLRYKETRRRKQEVPSDRERPLGNGSTAAPPSGRSKLNGSSSETLRHRKS